MPIVLTLGPFALGYLMSYLLRAVNAVVGPDLVRDIGLDAGGLGLLTAAYLLTFAAFQIPLGVLLDRYGPRRVQTVLFIIAALGCGLFALAESALTLTLARGLIGLGFAGGLMSGFKAVVLNVAPERRALANACIMAFGGLGIVLATSPTEWAVAAFGWRNVFLGFAAWILASAALIFLLVRERPVTGPVVSFGEQIDGVRRIYANADFWQVGPLSMLTAGAHVGLQTLWAGPWFRDVAGYDRGEVADALFLMGVAFLIGILFSGVVADRLVRRGVHILIVMFGFLAVFIASEVPIMMGWTSLALPAWFIFAMTGQASILAYPWLSSHFGAGLAGRTNTAINLLTFAFGFALQYLIGLILDVFPVSPAGGYDPRGYQIGFALVVAAQLASAVWFLAGARRLTTPANQPSAP